MIRILKNIEVNDNTDDQKLISSYLKNKDLDLLGVLYQNYMHLVYGVCLKYLKDREESKDAVMQIFEKLIIEIDKHEVLNFKSWLYVLTKNFCLMELRKKDATQKKIKQFSEEKIMESTVELHPIDETDDIDLNMALKKCIERLKNEQRDCIELFYFKEKCYKEISECLNLPVNKVKSFIQNGKRNLKICIEKENVQEKETYY